MQKDIPVPCLPVTYLTQGELFVMAKHLPTEEVVEKIMQQP